MKVFKFDGIDLISNELEGLNTGFAETYSNSRRAIFIINMPITKAMKSNEILSERHR